MLTLTCWLKDRFCIDVDIIPVVDICGFSFVLVDSCWTRDCSGEIISLAIKAILQFLYYCIACDDTFSDSSAVVIYCFRGVSAMYSSTCTATCCVPRAIRVQPHPEPCENWVLFLCTGTRPKDRSPKGSFCWETQSTMFGTCKCESSGFSQPGVQKTVMDSGFAKNLNSSQP